MQLPRCTDLVKDERLHIKPANEGETTYNAGGHQELDCHQETGIRPCLNCKLVRYQQHGGADRVAHCHWKSARMRCDHPPP